MQKHTEDFQIRHVADGVYQAYVNSIVDVEKLINILENRENAYRISKEQVDFYIERYTLHRIGNENSNLFNYMRENRGYLKEVSDHYDELIKLINSIKNLKNKMEHVDKALRKEYDMYKQGYYEGDEKPDPKAEGPDGKLR